MMGESCVCLGSKEFKIGVHLLNVELLQLLTPLFAFIQQVACQFTVGDKQKASAIPSLFGTKIKLRRALCQYVKEPAEGMKIRGDVPQILQSS